jgi:hypothetical protein
VAVLGALAVLAVLARLRSAWPPPGVLMVGRVIAEVRAGAQGAWSAVIMVGRVITEDRAGRHAPAVP